MSHPASPLVAAESSKYGLLLGDVNLSDAVEATSGSVNAFAVESSRHLATGHGGTITTPGVSREPGSGSRHLRAIPQPCSSAQLTER